MAEKGALGLLRKRDVDVVTITMARVRHSENQDRPIRNVYREDLERNPFGLFYTG